MIAPFDLFGEGKFCYTFQMKCRESENLWMEDGAVRIFLNTRRENPEEVSTALVELLRYFENTSDEAAAQCANSQIHEIHRRVSQIKSSEKIGVRYMQEWEERLYELQEAREEGGIQTLVLDNLEEGVPRERIVQKLQKRFSLDTAKAEMYFERYCSGRSAHLLH